MRTLPPFAALAAASGLVSGLRGWPMQVIVAGEAGLIGAFDEWHQLGLPGCRAGWDDFLADLAGGLLVAGRLARTQRTGAR